MGNINIGVCKLCLQEKVLLNKSHIIPNFLIKILGDKKNRKASIMPKYDPNGKIVQSGYWEGNILCESCDTKILSQLERYFEIHFFSKLHKMLKIENAPSFGVVPLRIKASRDKVKLFLLSILWRFSIAKKRLSDGVFLNKHQEIIRKMISENDAKDFKTYPYVIFSLLNKENYNKKASYTKLFVSPRHLRDDTGHQYRLLIPGFVIQIYISNHQLPDFIKDMEIDKNTILIGVTPEKKGKILVNQTLGVNLF